jgi:hypothetical protein
VLGLDFLFQKNRFLIVNHIRTYATLLKRFLSAFSIHLEIKDSLLLFSKDSKTIEIQVVNNNYDFTVSSKHLILPMDYLVRDPEKVVSAIVSKMGLNKTVFARNCEIKKITKPVATEFLNQYHLMNATQSAFNCGLFYKEELLAVASFSAGRKMRRLQEHQRSFELIRFCCKSGTTITGGLSKMLRFFEKEKQAGDIMTYVDKQWSDGSSFTKAGFKIVETSAPNLFLIDKNSFERILLKDKANGFDKKKYYLTQDSGNLKMIYHPHVTI